MDSIFNFSFLTGFTGLIGSFIPHFPEENEETQSRFAGKAFYKIYFISISHKSELKSCYITSLAKCLFLPEADCVSSLSSGKR
jgi:hypothetical protein